MGRNIIPKSFMGRPILRAFVLGAALCAETSFASQGSLQDEEAFSVDQSSVSSSSGMQSHQKRTREEISAVVELSTLFVDPSPSSSSSSSSSSSMASMRSEDNEGSDDLKRQRLSSQGRSQTYATPTYDGTFKYLLSKDDDVLQSFLDAFIPGENITVVRRLDTHLRPFAECQRARAFLNHKDTSSVAGKLSALLEEGEVKDSQFILSFKDAATDEEREVHGGGEFIKGFAQIYSDIKYGYPLPERNSQVDVLCEVNHSYYVIVEMQIAEEDFWDKRALAYAANLYGRQLSEGHRWEGIKKVICINFLGGSLRKKTWKVHKKFRKLTFKDQKNRTIEDGIEILQYPLYHPDLKKQANCREAEEEKTAYLEWLEFLEHADGMKESDMGRIKTPEVRKAYELVKSRSLPSTVLSENNEQDKELYSRYSGRMKIERAEGREKGRVEGRVEGAEREKIDIAKNLIKLSADDQVISKATGLSLDQITDIRSALTFLS